MRTSARELYESLQASPEDWSIRIRLIELAVETGAIEEAKRLVRTSPDEGPLPEELQKRIHRLLTGG